MSVASYLTQSESHIEFQSDICALHKIRTGPSRYCHSDRHIININLICVLETLISGILKPNSLLQSLNQLFRRALRLSGFEPFECDSKLREGFVGHNSGIRLSHLFIRYDRRGAVRRPYWKWRYQIEIELISLAPKRIS